MADVHTNQSIQSHHSAHRDVALHDALANVLHSSQQLARDGWRLTCWELVQQGIALSALSMLVVGGWALAGLGWITGMAALVMYLHQWLPLVWILVVMGAVHTIGGLVMVWVGRGMLMQKCAVADGHNDDTP